MEELEKLVEAEAWGRKWGMPRRVRHRGPSWGCWRLKRAEMRGQVHARLALVSVPTGTTARRSRLPQPPHKTQAWHAGIRSALLAGGRETASLTKAFLLSAPCHWSSIQQDLQISWFLDMASHHWWPILFDSWNFCLPGLWLCKPKFSQHWGGPVFPKLWVLGFSKNQDLADITLRSSNMRKNWADN